MQPGDVAETCADVDDLMRDVGFRPWTPIEHGVRNFIAWYRAISTANERRGRAPDSTFRLGVRSGL